jgi:hypothetical protein
MIGIVDDPLDHRSPELWEVELRYMTGYAMDDLRDIVSGLNWEKKPFTPTPEHVTRAFSLLASGLGCDVETFSRNRDECVRALESDSEARPGLLKVALDRLSDELGFDSVEQVEIETFALSDEE